MKTINTVVCGTGFVGRVHLEAVRRVGFVQLYGICDAIAIVVLVTIDENIPRRINAKPNDAVMRKHKFAVRRPCTTGC